MEFDEAIKRNGVGLLRSFLKPSVAEHIQTRFAANLARLANVYPDLKIEAARNVFPLSVPFGDPADDTLAFRMAVAAEKCSIDAPGTITACERALMREEVGNALEERLAFLGSPKINSHVIARFEMARPASDYGTGAVHQDATPALTLDPRGWTAWIALSPCGVDAPSLKYVERRFTELLPRRQDGVFLDANEVGRHEFRRPILIPAIWLYSAPTRCTARTSRAR
jgi:hypothetical protein